MIKKIKDDIIQMTLPTPFLVGPVNTYLIKGQALTLVDVGPKTDEALEILRKSLKEERLEMRDIEAVILTHHHPDHIGLLEEFIPYAKIYAHEKVKPWINPNSEFLQSTKNFYNRLYHEHGVPNHLIEDIEKNNKYIMSYSSKGKVDKVLKDGDKVDCLSDWTVMETPGHAQSHISLINKDLLMISGDHLIEHISSNAIIEAPYHQGEERPRTLLQYRESMEKCMHAKVAYSGHGIPIENPRQLIKNRLEEQDKKAAQFKSLMGDDPVTCFELCMLKYPHIYMKQPALTLSETLGHLDLLEERDEILKLDDNGVIKYVVNV